MPSASELRSEINDRTKDWEEAEGGSRREFEAAEAVTRAWSELDAALTEGTTVLPPEWDHEGPPGTVMVQTADLDYVMSRLGSFSATPAYNQVMQRLRQAVTDAKEQH